MSKGYYDPFDTAVYSGVGWIFVVCVGGQWGFVGEGAKQNFVWREFL